MINLTKNDVERIVETMLQGLSIEVKNGGFTAPNDRIVILKYNNTEITRTWFDVVQKEEYDG